VLYLKQLALLREKALKNFKSSLTVEGASEYDALAEVILFALYCTAIMIID
jgi:hypothetical protein